MLDMVESRFEYKYNINFDILCDYLNKSLKGFLIKNLVMSHIYIVKKSKFIRQRLDKITNIISKYGFLMELIG